MNRGIRLAWLSVSILTLALQAAQANEPEESIGLFEAIRAGHLNAQVIPKNSQGGTVVFTNQTGRPLSIRLPAAFAAVPVVAQFGVGGAGGGLGIGGNNGVNGGASANQGLGGGFGGAGGFGGGLNGGGLGGGFFNIGPERVIKLKFVAVCLEHGKRDPTPRIPYELEPIETCTKQSSVVELVKMLSSGEADQSSAQAAAWHLANGMKFEELKRKVGARHLSGETAPHFTVSQIRQAQSLSAEARRRAKNAAAAASPVSTRSGG
ncbi:MAG TPA: hypothetical protein VFV87_09375 [Pirellulaceae bacterium]|nr:hypothetical protein [Pirellulaceae bacterium]